MHHHHLCQKGDSFWQFICLFVCKVTKNNGEILNKLLGNVNNGPKYSRFSWGSRSQAQVRNLLKDIFIITFINNIRGGLGVGRGIHSVNTLIH